MANEEVCILNLAGLNPTDQKAVKEKAESILKTAREVDNMDFIEEKIKEYEKLLDAGKQIQKRNAILNRIKTAEIVDYLDGFGDKLDDGIVALWVGTQNEVKGARGSVGAAVDVYQNKYVSFLRAKLLKANLFKEFKSGAFDKEIFIARHRIANGQPLDGLPKEAIEIEKILKDFNDVVLSDTNRAGGFVGEDKEYVSTRHHDSYAIRKDKEGWIKFNEERLDWDRSLVGLPESERLAALTRQAKEFSSGVHITSEMTQEGVGGLGFSSLAKKLSKSRVYHFKTPEDEYDYMIKYGGGSLFSNVIGNIQTKAPSIAIMKKLGPNAEANFDRAVNIVLDKLKKSPDLDHDGLMKKVEAKKSYVKENVIPVVTGRSSIAGNEVGAVVESAVLAIQRTASLGGSAFTSLIGDPVAGAFNAGRLNSKSGVVNFGTVANEWVRMIRSLGEDLSDPEVQDMLADMAITNDYMIANLNPRFSENAVFMGQAERKIQNFENKFFFWNGQYFVDSRFRWGTALGLATRIGRNAGTEFDNLGQGYKRLFDTHSISKTDWDIARQSTKKFRDYDVLSIEGVKNLPDNVIDKAIIENGKKPSKFQRDYYKDELIDKFRGLMQDQQGYSILAADYRLRSMMFGNSKRGTALGFMRRAFWQFKQFPASFAQKVLGRELYSNSPMQTKIANVAAVIALSTLAGYVNTTLSDIRSGRKPKEFSGTVVGESLLRGGGLGIYSDFLYTLYNDKHGQSPLSVLGGATFADATLFTKSVAGLMQGDTEKASDNAMRLLTTNIPYQNHILLKPILDYVMMNQIREFISEGSLRRAERRLDRDYGQEYFAMKPSETMLLK